VSRLGLWSKPHVVGQLGSGHRVTARDYIRGIFDMALCPGVGGYLLELLTVMFENYSGVYGCVCVDV